MDKFKQLSLANKTLIILTSVMLVYGYLCRLLDIDFFWESKMLGWALLIVTFIGLLLQRIQTKNKQDKKTLSENIAIGLLGITFLGLCGWLVFIPQTDSYQFAKQYLLTDKTISNELGGVYNVVLVPYGGITSSTSYKGTTGQADLYFIVKGKQKFKDINVGLHKEVSDSNWTILK
ncbi:MAG: hypothetical protein RJA07_1438 [Bacteroidota bacterium]|jgi:uncharacterized protein with PQ loop repeat